MLVLEVVPGTLLSKLTPELLRPFLHYLRLLVVTAGDATLDDNRSCYSPNSTPELASFGIEAGDPLLTINARVIPPAAPTTSVTNRLTGESVFDLPIYVGQITIL